MEADDEFAVFVCVVVGVRRRRWVGVKDLLGNEGEFGEDCRVPLDNVFLLDGEE